MAAKSKPGSGRPTKYRAEFAKQAEKFCRLGATDFDLADFFEVDTATIWRWRSQNAAFCNACKAGKAEADDRVERSLYERAVGYSFHSEKIFHYQGEIIRAECVEHIPPDPGACGRWLAARRPEQWRDKLGDQIGEGFAEIWRAISEGRATA